MYRNVTSATNLAKLPIYFDKNEIQIWW
jgi:hypothetical protein